MCTDVHNESFNFRHEYLGGVEILISLDKWS